MLIELADDRRSAAQAVVEERLLDQPLAVVERPGHAHGRHVSAERRHLRFLERRHLAGRVQHDDAHARHAEEALRHRAAGVAGRGNQDGGVVAALLEQVAEHAGEEAGAEVLERQRRARGTARGRRGPLPRATVGAGKSNASRTSASKRARSNSSPTRWRQHADRDLARSAAPRQRGDFGRPRTQGRRRAGTGRRRARARARSASRKVTGVDGARGAGQLHHSHPLRARQR